MLPSSKQKKNKFWCSSLERRTGPVKWSTLNAMKITKRKKKKRVARGGCPCWINFRKVNDVDTSLFGTLKMWENIELTQLFVFFWNIFICINSGLDTTNREREKENCRLLTDFICATGGAFCRFVAGGSFDLRVAEIRMRIVFRRQCLRSGSAASQ